MTARPGPRRDSRGSNLSRRFLGTLALTAIAFTATASLTTSVSAARTISISESARLHLTSHKGFTLNEQGTAAGTIPGSIYIHLHITSTDHVTAEVNIYPHGGSITGTATASYHSAGAMASFRGTMNVSRGSGSYNHAHGTGLSFSGTVERTNDAVSVHVSGRIST